MLTAEEIAVQAMARVGEITPNYPTTRSVMYRRIGVKQQQMAVEAAERNHEYFGVCVSVSLVGGSASLAGIGGPGIPAVESIQEVVINDAGASSYAPGDHVSIVSPADTEAELPPRVTIRDRNLRQVGTDLSNVGSLMVYYTRLPDVLGPGDADTATEIPSPHDEILVVDLAHHLLRQATRVEDNVKAAGLGALSAELQELESLWHKHVDEFVSVASRFARPPAAPRGTV